MSATNGDRIRNILEAARRIRERAKSVGDGGQPSQSELDETEADLDEIDAEAGAVDLGVTGVAQSPSIATGRLAACQQMENEAQSLDDNFNGNPQPSMQHMANQVITIKDDYVPAIADRWGIPAPGQ